MRNDRMLMKSMLFAASLLIVACGNKRPWVSGEVQTGDSVRVSTGQTVVEEDENSTCGDEERLADRFPERDSINHRLVNVAEEIWHYGKGNDSIAAQAYNKERRAWCKKCEHALVKCFNSDHPGSKLKPNEKADSMLDEIEAFFAEDEEYTTWGMIRSLDLQNSFLLYRITAKSMQIEERDKSFSTEIKAWEELQNGLERFCVGATQANWYGGSGIGPASLATYNSIYENRLNDLKRIYHQGRQDDGAPSGKLNMVGNKFRKAVEALAMSIKKPSEINVVLVALI